MAKSILDWVAIVLVIAGAVNWGLVALGFNLVQWIFQAVPVVETVVYALVGLAGLYLIYYETKA